MNLNVNKIRKIRKIIKVTWCRKISLSSLDIFSKSVLTILFFSVVSLESDINLKVLQQLRKVFLIKTITFLS